MNFSYHNGTEVDTLAKASHVLVSATTEPTDELYVAGLWESGSALRAAGDLLNFGLYDNPITTLGLHAYASKIREGIPLTKDWSIFKPFEKRVGVVHVSYKGNLVAAANDYLAKDGMGYVQLDLMNGYPVQTNFLDLRTEEERKQGVKPWNIQRGWKHAFIDALLAGVALRIRVEYTGKASDWKMNYANSLIELWLMEDKVEALRIRNERIANRSENINVHWPVQREANARKEQRSNGVTPTPPADKETGELVIMVPVFGMKRKQVNMFQVAPGSYTVGAGSSLFQSNPYDWDPNNKEAIDKWLAVATRGLSIVEPIELT